MAHAPRFSSVAIRRRYVILCLHCIIRIMHIACADKQINHARASEPASSNNSTNSNSSKCNKTVDCAGGWTNAKTTSLRTIIHLYATSSVRLACAPASRDAFAVSLCGKSGGVGECKEVWFVAIVASTACLYPKGTLVLAPHRMSSQHGIFVWFHRSF